MDVFREEPRQDLYKHMQQKNEKTLVQSSVCLLTSEKENCFFFIINCILSLMYVPQCFAFFSEYTCFELTEYETSTGQPRSLV